jgi:large repetitive protein
VTITGTGFTGATAVNFGGTAAASFTVNSDTSIAAVSPTAGAGTVDVTVTTAGGTSATSTTDQFTFVAAPSVSGLSPNSGPVSGGTLVTITGVNFTDATAVSFGDAPAGFTVDSDTSITAVAPVGEQPDNVDVTVASLGGTSARSAADQFTWTPVLYVGVAPGSGPPTTPVTVSGGGFAPGETVKATYKTGLSAPSPASVILCTAIAAGDGTFTCSGTIPATAGPAGNHKVKAKGTTSLATATATFSLT